MGFASARAFLDVLHDLLHTQACGVCRPLDILARQMTGIPMVVVYLATPTRDTHGSYPLSLAYGR
jgi:hypothetical protein